MELFGTFNKDVNEARELWAKSSLLIKLVIVASIFLALADVVSEWRGFVLQAIELNRGSLIDSIIWFILW